MKKGPKNGSAIAKMKKLVSINFFQHISIHVVLLLLAILPAVFVIVELTNGTLSELDEQIEDLAAACSQTSQREKISRDPDFTVRNGYMSPKDLCGLKESVIQKILSLPHNCRRKSNRIYLEGSWKNALEMKLALHEQPEAGQNRIECVIFCVEQESPCLEGKCLIPLHLRRNSTDPIVARQLLDDGEYDMVHPLMDFRTVLDAGANCGVATVIFASLFPEATIVSVEPSTLNFEMLIRNTKPYRNVIPIRAALWSSVAELALIHGERTPGRFEWGYMVQEKSKLPQGTEVLDTIQGVSVDFLSEVLGLPGFDLLKIDIEGSEKEILAREHRSSFGWLNTAKMAMFEVHEDMRVGAHEAVASTFFHRRDWEWIRRFGEYHVYKKKGWGFVEHMQKNLTRNIEG